MATTASNNPSKHDRYCILMRPDLDTNIEIEKALNKLRAIPSYAKYISGPKDIGALPYHMTVIGGIKLDPSGSAQKIAIAKNQLVLFKDGGQRPELKDITVVPLSNEFERRIFLGLRLKFESGTYVLTGDHRDNEVLRSYLNADEFPLDGARHITLCTMLQPSRLKDSPELFEEIQNALTKILPDHKDNLMKMKLMPQIWKKPAGQEKWGKVDLTMKPYV